MSKICTKCKKLKPNTEFYKNGKYLHSRCKICTRKKDKKHSRFGHLKKASNWILKNYISILFGIGIIIATFIIIIVLFSM